VHRHFHRLKVRSSWRRLALHSWGSPADPSIYALLDIDVTQALAWIAAARDVSGAHVTVTHLVGVAAARALRERPDVNAIVRRGTGLWTRDAVDVFFMVARDGGEDLLGAKVEHADAKDPVAVARELERHVRVVRAHRAGALDRTNALLERLPGLLVGPAMKLTEALLYDLGLDLRRFGLPDDPFGSVMVTNVGMFGLPVALAPLVPFARTPVMITVGEIGDTPVAVEGRAVVRPVMTLGVTLDHRVLDGAQGGQLARAFRAVLEDPWGSLGPPVDDARARGPSAPAQA